MLPAFQVLVFFFFQAEDGIRDWSVTGVQTCALPISFAATFATRVMSRNPRDDAGREGGGESVFQQGSAAFVFLGLLEWGAASADGSTTLSGRLRWDSGGSAGQLLYAPAIQGACGCAGDDSRPGELHPIEQTSGDRPCRERCLRCAGRSDRRDTERTEAMSLRSGHDALQRRRFREVPDGGAGGHAEKIV